MKAVSEYPLIGMFPRNHRFGRDVVRGTRRSPARKRTRCGAYEAFGSPEPHGDDAFGRRVGYAAGKIDAVLDE